MEKQARFKTEEVICVAADNLRMYNPDNGNIVRHLHKKRLQPKTVALILDHFVIGQAEDSAELLVMAISKKISTTGTFYLPGKVAALAVTSCSNFVVAGIEKFIYIWRVDTGELLTTVGKHLQDITCVKFNADDSHVLTGGKDGLVCVWLLADLVAVNRPHDNKGEPRFVWNHHCNEVTDIHITAQNLNARVATVSSDMSCRLYELSTGVLITSVHLEKTPTAVTMDTLENFLFIGDNTGFLYQINLYELPRVINSCDQKDSLHKIHDTEIVSLTVSFDGSRLVSADRKCVQVWDVQSLFCTLRIDAEGEISNAFIALKPAVLNDENLKPPFHLVYFARQIDESNKPRLKALKPGKRTLSPMQPLPLGLCYPSSIKYTDDNQSTAGPSPSYSAIVEVEQRSDLVHTNNKLYSTALNIVLDKVGADTGLDTDELDMTNQQL